MISHQSASGKVIAIGIFIIVLGSVLVGCSPSLVYSPSVTLPATPLRGGDAQLLVGYSQLVETRPHRINRTSTQGTQGIVRLAFSDRVTLQVKGWRDIERVTTDHRPPRRIFRRQHHCPKRQQFIRSVRPRSDCWLCH